MFLVFNPIYTLQLLYFLFYFLKSIVEAFKSAGNQFRLMCVFFILYNNRSAIVILFLYEYQSMSPSRCQHGVSADFHSNPEQTSRLEFIIDVSHHNPSILHSENYISD